MQNPTPDNAELEVLRAELQAEYDAARDREYEAQCDTGVRAGRHRTSEMSAPHNSTALRGMRPVGAFLVVDPGKRTGYAIYNSALFVDHRYIVVDVPLHELVGHLHDMLSRKDYGHIQFVAVENYSLRGGVRNNDPSMPSAQGIGMCRAACEWTRTPMFLLNPSDKRAGRMALDDEGQKARENCRNDHQRDAIDLVGLVLREIKRSPQ